MEFNHCHKGQKPKASKCLQKHDTKGQRLEPHGHQSIHSLEVITLAHNIEPKSNNCTKLVDMCLHPVVNGIQIPAKENCSMIILRWVSQPSSEISLKIWLSTPQKDFVQRTKKKHTLLLIFLTQNECITKIRKAII